MNEELKRCPFCGGRDVKLVKGYGVGREQAMVQCEMCGATVSFELSTTMHKCITQWNKRRGMS